MSEKHYTPSWAKGAVNIKSNPTLEHPFVTEHETTVDSAEGYVPRGCEIDYLNVARGIAQSKRAQLEVLAYFVRVKYSDGFWVDVEARDDQPAGWRNGSEFMSFSDLSLLIDARCAELQVSRPAIERWLKTVHSIEGYRAFHAQPFEDQMKTFRTSGE